ncbi:MAG: hypothetical protein QOF01_1686 [Thermomicrobiales bacterium]|jgi:hypothetical protein|nr:hypothetical protein [Thermomicrobiales bacterium]MEA2522822.1 hypothetical protein [Thermomicrobiales bacterium]MEA2595217.1 hypothetical protein [Thermomicrobiales bacterium]
MVANEKQDDKPKDGNPNTIGEAGQVAGNTRDTGFGGARGGGTGTQPDVVTEGAEGGSAKGSIGAEDATR